MGIRLDGRFCGGARACAYGDDVVPGLGHGLRRVRLGFFFLATAELSLATRVVLQMVCVDPLNITMAVTLKSLVQGKSFREACRILRALTGTCGAASGCTSPSSASSSPGTCSPPGCWGRRTTSWRAGARASSIAVT